MSRKTLVTILGVFAFAATTFAFQTAAANLTGTWSGSFKPSDSANAETVHMALKHSGKELTGTAGPTAERQFEITKGVVAQTKEGTVATFDVTGDGPMTLHFELKLVEAHLKGTVKAEQGERKLTADVDLQRAK
jgi:hypothetical protein